MTIEISSAQEAAFNAAVEAIIELGALNGSLSVQPPWSGSDSPLILFTAKVEGMGVYISGSGKTGAEALKEWAERTNEELANPTVQPIRSAVRVKETVAAIVDEYRGSDAKLDELADRIAALPVRE